MTCLPHRSVHKWMLGLYGHAFLYLAPTATACPRLGSILSDGVPLEFHDRNRVGSECWDSTAGQAFSAGGFPTEFVQGAARFDMGGRPNVALLPALVIGMEQVLAWGGGQTIGPQLRPLTAELARRGRAMGFVVPQQHADHIVGLYPVGAHMPTAEAIESALARERVWVAARWGAVRVSPYLYNDMADIERLCEQLELLLVQASRKRYRAPTSRL
jgi:selenocysteine lyase/cysteine desulfurase